LWEKEKKNAVSVVLTNVVIIVAAAFYDFNIFTSIEKPGSFLSPKYTPAAR